jgi:hypothetical protein
MFYHSSLVRLIIFLQSLNKVPHRHHPLMALDTLNEDSSFIPFL